MNEVPKEHNTQVKEKALDGAWKLFKEQLSLGLF